MVLLTYTNCIGVDLVLKKFILLKKLGESGDGMVQVTDMFFFILNGE